MIWLLIVLISFFTLMYIVLKFYIKHKERRDIIEQYERYYGNKDNL